jgi:hypothetical protein
VEYTEVEKSRRSRDFSNSFSILLYSVETTYGINSVISKLMIFVKNAETGQFLFLIGPVYRSEIKLIVIKCEIN